MSCLSGPISCAQCASIGRSCCVGVQVFLTLQDIERLRQLAPAGDFYSYEVPGSDYVVAKDDPAWPGLVTGLDGRRRVLRTNANRECHFLTTTGCRLSLHERPLICRLFPYDFTEDGIRGIDTCCPLSEQPNWPVFLAEMDMSYGLALQWHRQLYTEIRQELALRRTGLSNPSTSSPAFHL